MHHLKTKEEWMMQLGLDGLQQSSVQLHDRIDGQGVWGSLFLWLRLRSDGAKMSGQNL
jgi:hypothetical protein